MARQALGKGFKALITNASINPEQAKVGDGVITVKVDEIKPSPFQPRRHFNEQQIEELADSIRESGLVQPLVLRKVDDSFELIAGERRLRAVKSLGMTEVKVVIHEATDQEVAEMALIENLQREDLTPLEEAEQYRLLQTKFGMKHEVIAKHVGKSRTVVSNTIRLLELEEEVRNMLETAEITVGHAKVLLQLKDAEQQVNAARRVVRSSLTVRQTENLVRNILNPEPEPKTPSSPAPLPPVFREICDQLSNDFGTKVNIALKSKSNGTIEIPYTGRDELIRILQIFGISASL